MGEAPADGADGGPPTHPLDPVGIAWQEYIVRTGGLHVLSPLVHDKRSAAINDARSPRPNSKGKMLHRFVIKTLLPDHPPHDTSLPNDLPFSGERQSRVRAYHGREEPRAQPAALRHQPAYERTPEAFDCCNGVLSGASPGFGGELLQRGDIRSMRIGGS